MDTYILGDIHGDTSSIRKWSHLYENSTFIQVGDLCLRESVLEELADSLARHGNSFYAVRGNHECESVVFDNQTYGKHHNLTLAKDYSLHKIGDLSFFFIGGGVSLDREWRIYEKMKRPNMDFYYSPDEKVIKNLSLIPENIDVLITHTAPKDLIPSLDPEFVKKFAKFDPQLIIDLDEEEATMIEIYDDVVSKSPGLKDIFCGHFHRGVISGYKGVDFRCLNIDEIFGPI